jgi:hypothetical protein
VMMLMVFYGFPDVNAQVSVTNDRWEREPGFTYPS